MSLGRCWGPTFMEDSRAEIKGAGGGGGGCVGAEAEVVPAVEGVVAVLWSGASCNLSICRSVSPNSNHSENGDSGGGGGRYSDMPFTEEWRVGRTTFD